MPKPTKPSEAVARGLCPSCLGQKVVFNVPNNREQNCSSCGGTGTLKGLFATQDVRWGHYPVQSECLCGGTMLLTTEGDVAVYACINCTRKEPVHGSHEVLSEPERAARYGFCERCGKPRDVRPDADMAILWCPSCGHEAI